jgi:hypothetical protein
VLPSTTPASPGLINVNDPRSPPTSSFVPQADVSLALLPDMVLDQCTTPAAVLLESSSAATPGSSTVPIVVAPAPRTRLQDGIRKPFGMHILQHQESPTQSRRRYLPRAGRQPCLINIMLSCVIRHGPRFLLLLVVISLTANGCIRLNTRLMGLSIGIRLG